MVRRIDYQIPSNREHRKTTCYMYFANHHYRWLVPAVGESQPRQQKLKPTPLGNLNVYSGLKHHLETLSNLVTNRESYEEADKVLMEVVGRFMKKAKEQSQGGNHSGAEIVSLPTPLDDRKVVKRVPPAGSPSLKLKRRRRIPGNRSKRKTDLSQNSVIPVDDSD